MKNLILISLLSLSFLAHADANLQWQFYTPEVVHDHKNKGAKGAVQLLWQHIDKEHGYEVEIDNGSKVHRVQTERHFYHVMLYFNKDYRWRVRSVGQKYPEFSAWRNLKVVRGRGLATTPENNGPHSKDLNVDEYYFDQGD